MADGCISSPLRARVDARIARRKVELLAEFDVAAPEVADILAAIDLHRLHVFSFWDALVLRSAKQAGCTVLFSEGLQQQREMDGVRIVNPFGYGGDFAGVEFRRSFRDLDLFLESRHSD
jgi:predicted nucleic acid-binding protein